MEHLIAQRQTGRTTRLILKGFELSAKGHAVYILCADHHQRIHASDLAFTLWNRNRDQFPSYPELKFETIQSLGGIERIDFQGQVLHGAHPNCELLIDPSFYEAHFGYVLNGYHKYDKQKAEQSFDTMDWEFK